MEFSFGWIKGSPQMMKKRPSDFFVLIQFNTNMIKTRLANVKFFLYASSIGVYSPAKIFKENSVWRTFHHQMISVEDGLKNGRTSNPILH